MSRRTERVENSRPLRVAIRATKRILEGSQRARGAILLYHFTDFYYLKNGGTILKEGLKAHVDEDYGGVKPGNVVCFTTESQPVWWWLEGKPSECRVAVDIPSTDKRLVKYSAWMIENLGLEAMERIRKGDCLCHRPELWAAIMSSWYIYFGDVSLSKFRAVEYADPKKRAAMARKQG